MLVTQFAISCQTKLPVAERHQIAIDSTFTFYEKAGINTGEKLKYIYHFSDRERISIQELAEGLEKDSIEVLNIHEENKRWHLSAIENAVHDRSSIATREKEFRWLMYKYKVDWYHGFQIGPADIDYMAIPSDRFYPFILSLDDNDLWNAAMQMDRTGDYEKALFAFDELIKRGIRPDTSYFKMGKALARTHEYVKGIEHWQKAVELNPDYLEAHLELGILFFENSHWKQAYRHFEEANRIRPDNDVILYHLSKSLIKLKRYNEAYGTIKRAVQLNPKNLHAKGVLKQLKSAPMRKLRREELKSMEKT